MIVAGLAVLGTGWAQASVNLPLHHWSYEAIERLTALGIIDRAMVVAKPYSRKQAAKYVARAIERIRSDRVPADGRQALAEPLLERLMQFLQPELVELGALGAKQERRPSRAASVASSREPRTNDPIRTDGAGASGGGRETVRSEELGETREALGVRGEGLGVNHETLGGRGETQSTPDAIDATTRHGSTSSPSRALSRDAIDAIRVGARLQVEGDAFSVGHGSVRLRENRMGQFYTNGEQVQSDLRGWFELGNVLALTVDPKFISNAHALGIGAVENNRNVYLQEFNAKLTLFNIAFQIGRSTNWWGPGYRGSLLLTDHAFPLDMVQLGSDEPFQLPWILRSLGQWRVNTFLTQLERDRDFPRAKVFGLRLSYLPTTCLELGANRLTQFDGRGRNQAFPKTVLDVYTKPPNQGGGLDVNEQVSIDFRAQVPSVQYLVPFPAGLQFYGEIGSEDKWSKYPLPSRAAVLGGIYIPQVFEGDTMDLRIEYADTDYTRRKTQDHVTNVWYNNGTYVSGMRYRGFPLGHWMGTDAIDFFVRSTRYVTDALQLGVNVEYLERARGQPVHEKKREAGVDLTWFLSSHTQFTFAYTYQRIENPGQITSINPFREDFATGVTSNNHLLWTNLSVEF